MPKTKIAPDNAEEMHFVTMTFRGKNGLGGVE
ncbi:hypothetical protein ABIA10_007597 [Rhizobium leguminosarum]|jgi:hypothetical protein